MHIEKQWISEEVLFSAIEEQLAEGRQAAFVVTGMSMWPFLCHGRDQVIIEKCNPSTLKVGDIILFQRPTGKFILHRITRIKDGLFETVGDGNCFRDGWFDFLCVRAKVVSLIRKNKTISCDSFCWKCIFKVWMGLFPIRRYLLSGLKGISRIKNRLKHIKKDR